MSFVLSVTLGANICVSAHAKQSRQAVSLYNSAIKAYNAGQYREALKSVDAAISEDAEFAEAHSLRGACRYQLKAFENAIVDLNQALRLNPGLNDARVLRGNVQYELNQWDEAVSDYDAVLQKDPNVAGALFGRGLIALRRDDYPSAQTDFKRFLKLRPNDPIAPELRKLLASLGGAGTDSAESTESAAPAARTSASTRRHSSPARAASAAKAFTESLRVNQRQLSDDYGRKTLRGQGGEAVGDVQSVISGQ